MAKARTHAGTALAAALVIPVATEIWFQCTYDFLNDDGSPDNALIRLAPFLALFALILCCAALIGFQVFGRYQLRRAPLPIASTAVFAVLASLPVPAWIYWKCTQWPNRPPNPELLIGSFWAYLFVSSLAGAVTQWVLIRRDRRVVHSRLSLVPRAGDG